MRPNHIFAQRLARAALTLACFFGASLAVPAQAQDLVHEVKVGVLQHDTDGLWSGYKRESGFDVNAEVILKSHMDLWGGVVRPAFGASVNSAGDTSKVYGAARWETDVFDNGFLALGLGGAVHNGHTKLTRSDRKGLGSKVLLYFPIELGYRINQHHNISLFFDHVSNAWLASPNEGMDTLGVRMGYTF